jgi:hypothetical protein
LKGQKIVHIHLSVAIYVGQGTVARLSDPRWQFLKLLQYAEKIGICRWANYGVEDGDKSNREALTTPRVGTAECDRWPIRVL